MALLHRLLILMLLGAARAPPPGGGGSSGSGDSCAEDGSSATYTETIKTKSGVSVREIVSTGCPNHESYCTGKPGHSCGDEGEQTTLVEATEQSLSVEVPANPKLKNSFTAGELDCSMGTVAYALNGVGFYSGAVAFDSGGNCPQLDVADPEAEWISFDCCSGHSTGSGGYHYHFPPSCLIAQANKLAPIAGGHSPQIGWAQDGFPIYGPLGPGGVEIRNCGASGAHPTYCQDKCGGYEGELPGVDNYKYRYYITGKVNDLNSLPSNPKPDDLDLYFPFTLRCHRGLTLSSVSDFKASGTDGFTSDHTATTLAGYSDPVAVQCLDNKGYTDYGFTEAVITPVDSADDVSEDVSEGETGAVTTESDAAATRVPRQFAVAGAAALAAALA